MDALDRHLPAYDASEVHRIAVAAPPQAAVAAARSLAAGEVPLYVALMALRALPELRRRPQLLSGWLRRPILRDFETMGFAVLEEGPADLVVGGVGRFWRLDGGLRPVTAEEFAAFDEPGYVRSALAYHAAGDDDGSVVVTETRVQATDEEARRRFARYWRVIGPGSAAIRLAFLRAIRRRAERA